MIRRLTLWVVLAVGLVSLWLPAGALVLSSLHDDVRPQLGFAGVTLDALGRAAFNADIRQELFLGILIAFSVAVICTLTGWCVGYQLRRGERLDRLAVTLAFFPLLVPPHALAWSLLWMFRSVGVPHGALAVIMAHVVMFFPVALLLHWQRAQTLGDIVNVAENLGIPRITVVGRVLWPHQRIAVLTAGVSVMALSLGESTVSYYLSGFRKPFAASVALGLQGAFDAPRYSVSGFMFVAVTLMFLLGGVLAGAYSRREFR